MRFLAAPDRKITSARIALLRRNQPGSMVFNLIASAVVAYILSFHEPAARVAVWLACTWVSLLPRLWWLSQYQRHTGSEAAAQRWENGYAIATLIHGATWAALFAVFTPADTVAVAVMHLTGASIGFIAIATLSASLRSYLALFVPIGAAQLFWVVRTYEGEAFAAIMLGGYYVVVVATGLTVFRRALLGALDGHATSTKLLAEQDALFNNSLVGLALTRERTFLRVNEEFARLYGFTRAAMEGRSTGLIYANHQAWLESVERAEAGLASGQVAYERQYPHPDGKQRWHLAQGTLLNPAESGDEALWVVTDITARKRAELELAAREQAFRNLAETYKALLETTPAMIWTTDAKGRYTFASERGTRALFGVSPAELTGKVFSDFVQPDDFPRELAVFKRVLAGQTLLDHATEGTRHDGRRITISVSGAPLHDAGGNIIGACGTNVDITDRQQRAADLEQARDLLRNAIDSIPDGFALFDADDRLVLANGRYIQLYTQAKSFSEVSGLTFEQLVRSSLKIGEPIPPEFSGNTEAWIAERVRRHRSASGQSFSYRVGSGRTIQVTERRTPDGGIVGVRTDITDLENARTLLMSAIDSMSDAFVLFDADDRVVLCNQRYTSMLEGFEPEQPVVGMHLEEIIHRQVAGGQPIPPEFTGSIEEWIAARLERHHRADGVPHIQQLASGRWIQSIRHRTPDGGIVVLRSDITSLKESEQAAQQLAQHDALTGLPNRRLLHDRLAQALVRARRSAKIVAVLVIDLDDFKPVNDTHGHRAGDEVLRITANRIKECIRAADTVARYGGDEFVVILDGLAQRPDAGAVAIKIIEAVARQIQPVWATTQRMTGIQIGCSIGISLFPRDTENADTLFRLADDAMYKAKEAGRGRLAYHSGAT